MLTNLLHALCRPFTLFRLRAHGGCDRSAEDAYSSMAPDLTFAFVGGPCCLTLDFVYLFFFFWIMITFNTMLPSPISISLAKAVNICLEIIKCENRRVLAWSETALKKRKVKLLSLDVPLEK